MVRRKAALVLSSGGARGYAHIGAIEALMEKGFEITSVAGASMGALIGGMFCAGKLEEVKQWLTALTNKDILALVDWSISMNHLLKGDKLITALKEIVPDVTLEELPIPFCAVATDLETQREVVFRKRSLYRAIRASISIPSVLKPVRVGRHVLVDGGVANPLPLNRVARHEGDLLVSVNVSAPASEDVSLQRQQARDMRHPRLFSMERMMQPFIPEGADSNYLTMVTAAVTMLIQRNTVLAQKITPPDIAVDIPMNRFGVFDFKNVERIAKEGYEATLAAIEAWETAHGNCAEEKGRTSTTD